MADQNLAVTITADASSVAPAIVSSDQLAASLAGIEKALAAMAGTSGEATAATAALGASHAAAATATEAHAAAESLFGASIGKVEVATNSAARMFSALGVETGLATERVSAFTEGLEALGKAALPLLAVGAAVLAVAEAFNFLGHGVEEASKLQLTMTTLEQAVRNQGGAWNETTKNGVENYLTALQTATTYSRGEALEALNTLVSAGTSLSDAQKIVAISTDVAAGSHRHLIDVVNLVIDAEKGRGQGLVALDLHLKDVIRSHKDLQTGMDILSADFQGDATAAAGTYEGKQISLRNELDTLSEEIGSALLPELEHITDWFIGIVGLVEAATTAFQRFSASFHGGDAVSGIVGPLGTADTYDASLKALESGGPANGAAANAFHAFLQRSAANIGGDSTMGLGALSGGGPFSDVNSGGYDTVAASTRSGTTLAPGDFWGGLWADAEKRAAAMRAQWAHDRAHATDRLQNDPIFGNEPKGRSGGGAGGHGGAGAEPFEFAPTPEDTGKTDAFAASNQKLDDALKRIHESEAMYKVAVEESFGATAKASAQLAEHVKISQDAALEAGLLTNALNTEKTELAALTTEIKPQKSAMDEAYNAWQAYGKALNDTEPTKQQRAVLKELEDTYKSAKTTWDTSKTSIDALSRSIESHTTALNAAMVKAHDYTIYMATEADAAQKLVDEFDKQTAKIVEDGNKKRAQRELDLADELATYGKSTQAQLTYYAARYAAEVAADGIYSDEAQKLYGEVLKLEGKSYEDREAAHAAFLANIKSTETTLLDDIISKHENFATTLKSIWQTIAQDIEKSAVQGLVNGPLASLTPGIASIFGGPSLANQNVTAPPALVTPLNAIQQNTAAMLQRLSEGGPGGLGASSGSDQLSYAAQYGFTGLFSGSSASRLLSGLDTSSLASIFGGSDLAASALANLNSAATTAVPAGGFSTDAEVNTALASIGLPQVAGTTPGGGTGGWASLLKSGGQALGLGELATSLTGGNATYGGLGALAGSALGNAIGDMGGATGGPLGQVIGSLVGGAIGGLFGPHWASGSYPDRSDTQNYGSTIADLSGRMISTNGQNFSPDQQMMQFIAAMGVGNGGLGTTTTASNGTAINSGGVDAAEIWLSQQNPNSPPPGYTQAQWAAQLAQFQGAFGSSATGAGALSWPDSNIGDLLVTGAGKTQTTTYQTMQQYLQEILGIASSQGSNTPVYGLTRTYPSFASTLGPQEGVVNSQTNAFTPTNTGATATGGGTVTYTINVNAAPIGVVPADIATAISQALKDISSGIVPGSTTLTLAQRAGVN